MPDMLLKSYPLSADNSSIEVKILSKEGEFVRTYFLDFPEFGAGTKALLENLKRSLVVDAQIKAERLADPKFIAELKKKFDEKSRKFLSKELPDISEKDQSLLITALVNEMLGLGNIELLLEDPNLEEIVVNSAKEPVWIYHKEFGWLKTNILIKDEAEVQNYASIIARRVGKQITILNPLLDAHLTSGDRANATLFPISGRGNTLTIRRFRRDPWTVVDFIKNKTTSSDVMALIWMAMQYELNIILSGGTASGKTSFLNVCMPFIQPNHRIISIEDSVAGESELLYEHEERIKKATIAELIDGIIEDDSIKDTIVENDEGIRVLSTSKSGIVEWKEPSHFIRHWVKKNLIKITLKSGRNIEVTADHSLFSLDQGGKISPVAGAEIKEGTWLATPRLADWQGQPVVFRLNEHLKAFEGCFIKSFEVSGLLNESKADLCQSFCRQTVNHSIRKNFARVEMLMQLQKAPKTGVICSKLGTSIPLEIEIDEDLACFAGLWLADGCYDRNSILVSVVEPEARATVERVAGRFGLSTKMHSDGEDIEEFNEEFEGGKKKVAKEEK